MATAYPVRLPDPERTQAHAPGYSNFIGYLRAFLTVLVVAHHAMLAYHQFAPPPPTALNADPQMWRAFPVSDSQRWEPFTLLVGFNDIFFMSLMFFISGLFVWKSLARKGAGTFLKDRVLRLGVPYAVAVLLLSPLTYWTTYLTTPGPHSPAGFWSQLTAAGSWPPGPAWFIAVLLVFDCLAALAFMVAPGIVPKLASALSGMFRTPIRFFAVLLAASAMTYLPMVIVFGPMDWFAWGPFTVQSSRALHYLAYFALGALVGSLGIESGFLSSESKLARRWPLWSVFAVIAFVVTITVTIAAFTSGKPQEWAISGGTCFVVCCAASSFMFLALFRRYANRESRLWSSLRDNAYGIYLVHYAVVAWLQYGLLNLQLPGAVKGLIATTVGLVLSWAITSTLRRVPGVQRVL